MDNVVIVSSLIHGSSVRVFHTFSSKYMKRISITFWVCTFSNYQNDGDGDKPTIKEQLLGPRTAIHRPSVSVLKQVDMMLSVVTKGCDIYYTRLWYV